MLGVILIAVLNVAMFSWFFYLAANRPAVWAMAAMAMAIDRRSARKP